MARTASPVATASTATSCCSKPPPWQPWQTRMSSRALQRVSHGVSLIEVLVVVGLMALALALFSGVLGGGLDGLRLRNATKTLAAQLRYTRAAAIHTGEPRVLALDVDAAHWHTGQREGDLPGKPTRSEEHTSELQSLMRISYAVFCLKKKNNKILI